jgi:hypothetical protein
MRVSKRYILLALVLLLVCTAVAGWRYWLNQNREWLAGELQTRYSVSLQPADGLVSVDDNTGIDLDCYFYLKLTPATLQALKSSMLSRRGPTTRSSYARWPWKVPHGAEVYEWHGCSVMFDSDGGVVYYYVWSS